MYARGIHVIKLLFVFLLLICLLLLGALSQEPRMVQGKLFFLPYNIAVLSLKAGKLGRISRLQSGGRMPCFWGSKALLLGPDWMKSVNILEDNLLYTKSTDLNVIGG